MANSPSFEDAPVLEFFQTSGRNLLAAEAAAGVGHHVALSVVGTDRLLQSGYFRAKMAQEDLIKASKIPYTILRSTQFFEFLGGIAQSATDGETVRFSPALMQPVVSDDVAAALADVRSGPPPTPRWKSPAPKVPSRRPRPTILEREPGWASGGHRRTRTLLRRRAERPVAHPGRAPARRPHAFRGLAQPLQTSKVSQQGKVDAQMKQCAGPAMNCTSSPVYAFPKNTPFDPRSGRWRESGVVWWMCMHELGYQRRRTPMFTRFLCGVAFAVLSMSAASADSLSTVLITTDQSKITLVFDRALPNVPGKSLKGVLVEYSRAAQIPRIPIPTPLSSMQRSWRVPFVAKSMTVRKRCITPGELAEVPGDHHAVSANDSDTQPARLLPSLSSIPTKRTSSRTTNSETKNRTSDRDAFELNQ